MMAVVRLLRSFTEASDSPSSVSSVAEGVVFQEDDPDESYARAARWRRFVDEINGGPPPNGLYQKLLKRAGDGAALCSTRKQIEKDVKRTFGSVRGLRVPQQEALQSLRNVLLAYAEHNPQVGYCQSMNFLAAVLLLVVDEESAFWCLTAIVERLMPGHFSACMAMALVDQGVLSDFLRLEDAELVEHLERLQVAPSLVTTQWLLTCFVGSAIPLGALLRIWDAFLRDKEVALLFRVAAALLVAHRDALLAVSDTGEAYRTLTSLGTDLVEPKAVEELLAAAGSLAQRALLAPRPLTAARERHAARLEDERGLQASQVACAAVATATATASELLAAPDVHPAMPAAGTEHARGDWTLVPASSTGGSSECLEGWSLVERQSAGACVPLSSLSYVILQIEAPRLLEGHFGAGGGRLLRGTSEAVAQAAARLDALT